MFQSNHSVIVGNQHISENSGVFFIAEAGVNHCGRLDLAKKLIELAANAGANAVKFQSFVTAELILPNVKKAAYQQRDNSDETQADMLQKLELSTTAMKELQEYAKKCHILFLTTPFDHVSLYALDALDLPVYKISSTDVTNVAFIEQIAQRQKPIFISTGMSDLDEIEKALYTIFKYHRQVVLLQCTAGYPIADTDVHLRVLHTFASMFDVLVGYSDHTEGIGAAPFAVTAGAVVIEKHFTLDKMLPGPDHKASLDPEELAQCIAQVRYAEKLRGDYTKYPLPSELSLKKSLQKSLVCQTPIRPGDCFTIQNVVAKRTGGHGLDAIFWPTLEGVVSTRGYSPGDLIEQ
jgi:N,N'-diacetyllegionaminate synthase